ncbi:AAA family ATPase [Motilimonas eburnea]|uniref:AAA family ATPase n=1 Tax=Motilimonas eburnea TaxID=1737488 RepID=UPI001E3A5586|nr:SMC family ATPase [Motilimonas eburnea]MCE2570939.1 SMC family ATPase [Motilimonas eburnea]
MRPVHLTMAAFGPFADQQVVDFEKLGRNPLFLLNGPTGAGKTSILDAICFALYGKTTGDEREAAQMRCDYADEQTLTQVELVFELGEQRYRIVRIPEQQRPKKSGDGMTEQKPQAELYRLDGDAETLLVASKVSEANQLIEQLTGLDVDQFRQVMVLPQGKFRQLLMADSKDREKIFSQLFQTQIYRQIEDNLKNQAAKLRKNREGLANQRQGIMDALELTGDNSLSQEQAELSPRLELALGQKIAANKAYDEANQALASAKGIAADFELLAKLDAEKQQLDAQLPVIKADQTRQQQAEHAQKIEPSYAQFLAREKEYQASVKACEQQTEQLRQAEQHQAQQTLEYNKLGELTEQLQQQQQGLQQLTAWQTPVGQLSELSAKITALSQAHQQQQKVIDASKQQLQQGMATQQGRQKQLAEQGQLADTLVQHQQHLSQLETQLQSHQQWQQAQQALSQLSEQLNQSVIKGKRLSQYANTAEQAKLTAEYQRHLGQAAILAQQLAPNTPCLVCGSTLHPAPAQPDAQLPSEEQIEALTEAFNQANQALLKAREEYAALKGQHGEKQQQVNQLAQSLGELTTQSSDALAQRLQGVKSQCQQAQQAQLQVKQLNEQLANWQQQEAQLRQQIEQQQGQERDTHARLSQLQGQFTSLNEQIPAELRELSALTKAIAQGQTQVAGLDTQINQIRDAYQQAQTQLAKAQTAAQGAEQQQQSTKAQLAQAQSQFEQQCEGVGFATLEQFKQACLTPQALSQLIEGLNQYQTQCQRNQAQREQLSAKLAELTKPDLAKLNEQCERALAAKNQAELSWQQLQQRQDQLTKTATQLAGLDEKLAKLDQDYEVVGTLAAVANGQTGNKISLQRFVLSVLLDDVLLDASTRLQLMSKGRYRLLRKEERAKGNKASGLELEVEDAYTGKVRSVATLSGGESFMAALAMALGLSEVVQAYAGGIKLDTLFIDEGFGSLDQESLDLAIRTLMDLQNSGRMVGVISHVSEMKEQLGMRIDVIKSSLGSRLALVLP